MQINPTTPDTGNYDKSRKRYIRNKGIKIQVVNPTNFTKNKKNMKTSFVKCTQIRANSDSFPPIYQEKYIHKN